MNTSERVFKERVATRRESPFLRVLKLSGKYLLLLSAMLTMSCQFYSNFFRSADYFRFQTFAGSTGSYVIGRLAKSQQDGIFSSGGLIGTASLLSGSSEPITDDQFAIYFQKLKIVDYKPYKSTSAIQGIIFSMIDKATHFSPQINIKIFRMFTSVLTSLVFIMIIYWIYYYFGSVPAFFVFLSIVISPWLTIAGGHLYWVLGTFYLPFIATAFLLHLEKEKNYYQRKISIAVIFFAVLGKCLFTGYELVTTSLVMMTIPYFFYAIYAEWEVSIFLDRLTKASACAIAAVMTSMVILVMQIAVVDGSLDSGFKHIVKKFFVRTSGTRIRADRISQEDLWTRAKNSIEADRASILKIYFESEALNFENFRGGPQEDTEASVLSVSFAKLMVLFAIASMVLLLVSRFVDTGALRKNAALIVSAWVSVLAPFSWFLIFKRHSYMHPFLDNLAWHMPFTLLGFAICGAAIASFFKQLFRVLRFNAE